MGQSGKIRQRVPSLQFGHGWGVGGGDAWKYNEYCLFTILGTTLSLSLSLSLVFQTEIHTDIKEKNELSYQINSGINYGEKYGALVPGYNCY